MKALITGVSRIKGIGFAIAKKLAEQGADIFIHSFSPYDSLFPWKTNENEVSTIISELKKHGGSVEHIEADFNRIEAPGQVIEAAFSAYNNIHFLILNHAYSTTGSLSDLTAENIDLHNNINIRSTLLLIKEWSLRFQPSEIKGRVIMMTSGQHIAPSPGELSYVASKGAIHQLTLSLSAELVQRGITVNTVNPGPTNSYECEKHYPELYDEVLKHFPQNRWGTPEDAANLIAFLASPESQWISGEVINSDGGSHY
ncbi:MAG: hypothetical protein A2Y33_10860 [Spirochaetes bacterium GWF1_51_8]|nr:MAG: hypothetical protein A2Y33_10860 [Spirochaetes bacterium GWF1_51_8]